MRPKINVSVTEGEIYLQTATNENVSATNENVSVPNWLI